MLLALYKLVDQTRKLLPGNYIPLLWPGIPNLIQTWLSKMWNEFSNLNFANFWPTNNTYIHQISQSILISENKKCSYLREKKNTFDHFVKKKLFCRNYKKVSNNFTRRKQGCYWEKSRNFWINWCIHHRMAVNEKSKTKFWFSGWNLHNWFYLCVRYSDPSNTQGTIRHWLMFILDS